MRQNPMLFFCRKSDVGRLHVNADSTQRDFCANGCDYFAQATAVLVDHIAVQEVSVVPRLVAQEVAAPSCHAEATDMLLRTTRCSRSCWSWQFSSSKGIHARCGRDAARTTFDCLSIPPSCLVSVTAQVSGRRRLSSVLWRLLYRRCIAIEHVSDGVFLLPFSRLCS